MDNFNSQELKVYNKARRFYQVNTSLILFAIIISVVIRPVLENFPTLLDSLVAIPLCIMIILVPIGLVYSWKAYKNKIGIAKKRFKYFITHLFLTLIITGLILFVIKDISKFFHL